MIGQMIGDADVGLYSAASRLSEVGVFFPAIIASSVVPAIMKYREKNNKLYDQKFQQLYFFIVAIMVAAATLITFHADNIISLIYGPSYQGASNVLAIQFWVVVFIALAIISGRYLINAGLQRITMLRHLLGVILNIPLNYIFINKFGIEGAAFASLISLIVTNYFFDILDARTRILFRHKSNALFFTWIIWFLVKCVKRKIK
jgi:O-antigen/teichoic acid export membrane protein